MNYLFFISLFGAAVCIFLWLRDIRIFIRTSKAGYREAAYKGVLITALASSGTGITYLSDSFEILGTGFVLLALYLQGKINKEKIWTNQPPIQRFLGRAPKAR